jgi:hypothetical protein
LLRSSMLVRLSQGTIAQGLSSRPPAHQLRNLEPAELYWKLGCGEGHLTGVLAEARSVTGVDIRIVAVERAKALKLKNSSFGDNSGASTGGRRRLHSPPRPAGLLGRQRWCKFVISCDCRLPSFGLYEEEPALNG